MLKRLDKFLCDKKIGTRSQVKTLIQKGQVTVNGEIVKKSDIKVCDTDIVTCQGEVLSSEEFGYFMFHKPAGVISATEDTSQETVLDFFKEEPYKNLYPVGRLDKDTEGLLLITNDGPLGHKLLSPKKHVPKMYYAKLAHGLSLSDIEALEKGVDIGEKNLTLPAKIEVLEEFSVHITITEGKFHQVKRMFEAVDNQVLYLKRISMGALVLDDNLKCGEYRKLTDNELKMLKEDNYVAEYKSRNL